VVHELVRKFKPKIIVIDPITNLIAVGDLLEVRAMLTRLIDFLKAQQITTLFTSLTESGASPEQSEVGISSLIDTWIVLGNLEDGGERNRVVHVLKSRGMAHSNQAREFLLSRRGIELVDVYVEGGEVLVGAAREAKEAQRAAEAEQSKREVGRLRRGVERKRQNIAARIAALKAEAQAELEELRRSTEEETLRIVGLASQREAIRRRRMADTGQLPATKQARARRLENPADKSRDRLPPARKRAGRSNRT
jgi:circadian clock protein KaiC